MMAAEWKDSNGFNPLRKVKLSGQTDDQIRGLLKDFSAARAYHGKLAESFARSIKELSRELALRGQSEDGDEMVTDHAVVRYLERHGGLDIEAVRAKVRRLDGDMAPRSDARILTVLSPHMIG